MADKEKILKDTLQVVIEGEGIQNPEVDIKPISTEGANYSSVLYLVTIKSPGKEDLQLFAKVASAGERLRKEMQADHAYKLEGFIYSHLSKIYKRLQDINDIPVEEKYTFPKFYAFNEEYLNETLVLENLVAEGYALYDRLKSVTWEYASMAIGELAKFHALSHAFAQNNPDEFDKVCRNSPAMFCARDAPMFKMWKNSEAAALEVIPEESRDKLRNFFDRESTTEKYVKYYSPSERQVLVHGDYRPSNLLHKAVNGKLEKLIPVDYQIVHSGVAIVDILFFIFLGSDGEFRRLHYKRLIEHYYSTFADFLIKLHLDPKKVYPIEEFYEDLKRYLPFGLLIAACFLPVILIEAENAPATDGNVNLSTFTVKPNEMFEKRFREIFNDYEEWGLI